MVESREGRAYLTSFLEFISNILQSSVLNCHREFRNSNLVNKIAYLNTANRSNFQVNKIAYSKAVGYNNNNEKTIFKIRIDNIYLLELHRYEQFSS